MEQGIQIVSILIAGVIFYGGVGWLLDRWLGTMFWTPCGIIVGTALGVYWVVKKYGQAR
ncbi:MAG: AtpZ/AtpI family protein [Propionibacteriaceae bacterium]|jgi:F0F1-type ATP synthase assembly protein I|nr:AtpZ/AtpI family protein [Propionibacteriaceae bacterium]